MEPQLIDCIRAVAKDIEQTVRPEHIILFNQKTGVGGKLISFKLCVVVNAEDKSEIERRIYLGIESELPFDVVLYTPDEWRELLGTPHSFARTINETGVVVL